MCSALLSTLLFACMIVPQENDDRRLPTVDEVLSQIRAAEQLYRDLELTYSYESEYVLGADSASQNAVASLKQAGALKRVAYEVRSVWQGFQFYCLEERDLTQGWEDDPNLLHYRYLSAHDGTETRLVENVAFGNIHEGRVEGNQCAVPHTWGFVSRGKSLAELLDPEIFASLGKEGSRSHAVTRWERYGDLDCVRFVMRYLRRKPENDVFGDEFRVLLAPDRNWMAVRGELFNLHGSSLLPVLTTDAQVNSWRELAPGLWLPDDVGHKQYGPMMGLGNEVELVRGSFRVKSARLNPSHPPDFFRIEFPPGLKVYRVRDGKITGSYYTPRPRTPWITRLSVAGVACLVLGAIAWAAWKLRRQSASV